MSNPSSKSQLKIVFVLLAFLLIAVAAVLISILAKPKAPEDVRVLPLTETPQPTATLWIESYPAPPGGEEVYPAPGETSPAIPPSNNFYPAYPAPEEDGKLALVVAEEHFQKWIVFRTGPEFGNEYYPLEEITTDEVWQHLQLQAYRVLKGAFKDQVFINYQGRFTDLGFSPVVSDLYITDLDDDGTLELLFQLQGFSENSGPVLCVWTLQALETSAVSTGTNCNYALQGFTINKVNDFQVELFKKNASGKEEQYGVVQLGYQNMQPVLSVVPQNSDEGAAQEELARFANDRLSLHYPTAWKDEQSTWNQIGGFGSRITGEDGFVEVVGPVYGDWGDLMRTCEWEFNVNPAYGTSPKMHFEMQESPDLVKCVIRPQEEVEPGMVEAHFIKRNDLSLFYILRGDAAHMSEIVNSVRIEGLGDREEPIKPDEGARTFQFNGLTIEEIAVEGQSGKNRSDTPGDSAYNNLLQIWEQRGSTTERRLAKANDILAGFGYRLEQSGDTFTLYRGKTIVKDGLDYFSPVTSNGVDFALPIRIKEERWLVQKGGLTAYNMSEHHYTYPIYVGPHLITVVTDPPGSVTQVAVLQDGEMVFHYRANFWADEPVKALEAWDGRWVLEVQGTLIVDGTIWNLNNFPAQEIFGFHFLHEKPFFFFKRDGKFGVWYGGQEIGDLYDLITHDNCCMPARFNTGTDGEVSWFFGKRSGNWYYVEVRKE